MRNSMIGDTAIKQEGLSLVAAHVKSWQQQLILMFEDLDSVSLDLSIQEDCDTAGIQLLLAAKAEAISRNKTLILKSPSVAVSDAAQRLGIVLNESFQVTE